MRFDHDLLIPLMYNTLADRHYLHGTSEQGTVGALLAAVFCFAGN